MVFRVVVFFFFLLSLFVAKQLAAEKERIDVAERQAEKELLDQQQQMLHQQQQMMMLSQQMNEKFAQLSRLREQRKQVNVRGEQMLRKGAQSLDDLDEIERQESEFLSSIQGVDFSSSDFLFDPSLGANLEFLGSNLPSSSGGTALPPSSSSG